MPADIAKMDMSKLHARLPKPGPRDDTAEFDSMVKGGMYRASDPYVQKIAGQESAKVRAINDEKDDAKRKALLREFMGLAEDVDFYWIVPFFAEYGFNLTIGTGSGVGPGATVLNVCPVSIGERTLLGPNVQIYAATHPNSPEERNGKYGREYSKPIVIGDDCWVGGAAIFCPGVTVGNGSTVAAGAVVTKDVPPRSVVAGNPARVIKTV